MPALLELAKESVTVHIQRCETSLLLLRHEMTLLIYSAAKHSHKFKRVTRYRVKREEKVRKKRERPRKRDAVYKSARVVPCRRLRDRKFRPMKGERKLNVARFRSGSQDRVVEYIDSCIRSAQEMYSEVA